MPFLGAVYPVGFALINANLTETAVPLIKAGLRDLFNQIPRACTYQGVRNVSFSEKLTCFVFL